MFMDEVAHLGTLVLQQDPMLVIVVKAGFQNNGKNGWGGRGDGPGARQAALRLGGPKNRRSCSLCHKMINSGNGPKRMTSSEMPQCQKAKHINTMWKLLFCITPPQRYLVLHWEAIFFIIWFLIHLLFF